MLWETEPAETQHAIYCQLPPRERGGVSLTGGGTGDDSTAGDMGWGVQCHRSGTLLYQPSLVLSLNAALHPPECWPPPWVQTLLGGLSFNSLQGHPSSAPCSCPAPPPDPAVPSMRNIPIPNQNSGAHHTTCFA